MVGCHSNLLTLQIQFAHADTTGQEILEDFGADGLDAFVAGIGTGGTISGVSKTLKIC